MRLTSLAPEEINLIADEIACGVIERTRFPTFGLLEMMLTNQCNLRCSHCFISNKHDAAMSEETAIRAVDYFLDRSREAKEVSFLFFGGEPMLEWELIRRVVFYAEDKCKSLEKAATFNMTTNGTLFDEDKLRFCRDHRLKFLLSINGVREDHDRHRRQVNGEGSFDLIAGKLWLMKRYQPWQGARYTVFPDTAGSIQKGVAYLYSLGVNQFIIGPAYGAPWDAASIEVFRQEMLSVRDLYRVMQEKKEPFRMTLFEAGDLGDARPRKYRGVWGCGAGRGRLCVAVNGDLYGCSKLLAARGVDQEGIYKLGNISESRMNLKTRAELIAPAPEKRTTCMTCDLADECAGGCPAVNWQETGSIYLPAVVECKFSRVFAELRGVYENSAVPAPADS